MDPIEAARRSAKRIRDAETADGADPWCPMDVVTRAIGRRGLWANPVPPGDVSLFGGRARLDPSSNGIVHEETGSPAGNALLIAHELGHVVLHCPAGPVITTDTDPSRSAEPGSGVERLADYSRGERRELQADLFARELVLPRVEAKAHHERGMSATAIADRLGVPVALATQQLLDALLLPPLPEPAAPQPADAHRPDPMQDLAVAHRGSPFQLQAGPGTGKTHTLVRRVVSLIDEGIDPNGILVLTFSNKAAGELMDRLTAARPEASASVWIGTFHAFGLDVVRRFHDRARRSPSPMLVDRATGVAMIEEILPTLPLARYRDLWDPVHTLSDLLGVISRAKDELVDPDRYLELAAAMAAAATDADAVDRAERAREEGLVYQAYERLLEARDALDFGDLIMKPVRIATRHPEVGRALTLRHRHVLVDEYQDVNLASVRLIGALAADGGERLWVVGDGRQSIYRFRGATSANMAAFPRDYPNAVVRQLEVNYRSYEEIIDTFKAFAGPMAASRSALELELTADRGRCGRRPTLHAAGTPEDELSAVAASIAAARAAGVDYRDQAVLCAANERLGEFADGLAARGIPALYLGPLFERGEVKDLLSLLALFHDPRAASLARVATVRGFEMDLGDVASVAAHLRHAGGEPLAWLDGIDEVPGLSTKGRGALERLHDACAGFEARAHPWTIASTLIVDRLGVALRIARGEDPQAKMAGVALWQFVNFLKSLPSEGRFPTAAALDRIRRLVLLKEERHLRQFPDAALEIDAVRLMTIHGSKGLEFPMVHAPGLIKTGIPRTNKPPPCPPPDGMVVGSEGLTGVQTSTIGHLEQEECLFFVLLSRARDDLRLYASTRQANGKRRNRSEYVDRIAGTLGVAERYPGEVTPPARAGRAGIAVGWDATLELDASHLASYEKCGLRFFYTYVLGLGGRRVETGFMQMHNAVEAMLAWLDENFDPAVPTPRGHLEAFEAAWATSGPADHAYAAEYRAIAERMLGFLAEIRGGETRRRTAALTLDVEGARVVVRPHDVVEGEGGVVVRQVRTGRSTASASKDIGYFLLSLAAAESLGASVVVEAVHLTDERRQLVAFDPLKTLDRRDAIARQVAGMLGGAFEVRRGRSCPRCPHYFTCPGLPEGRITARAAMARTR